MPNRSKTTQKRNAVRSATGGGLVWDDVVVRPAWSALTWSSLFEANNVLGNPLYRPMVGLVCLIDQTIWGETNAGWHLTNLLLHGAAVAMTYRLVRKIAGGRIALGVGIVFALHPAVTEVADWICARA